MRKHQTIIEAPRRALMLCGTAMALALMVGGFPLPADAGDGVVSYRGSSPSADELIKSFTGGGAAKAKQQQSQPAFHPRTRGIRFNDPTPAAQTQEAAPVNAAAPAETAINAQPQQQPQAPAPQPTTTAAAGGCPASGTAVALEIKFAVNSAVLQADAYRNLRQMAQAMNSDALRGCTFAVEGHTDASGNQNYNVKLSKLRANSVKNFLMSMDISSTRLKTAGKGSQEPLNPKNKFAPENRRVQFRILGPAGG